MPFYQFICEKCGMQEEDLLPIQKRKSLRKCPKCKSVMIRLVGSAKEFILKGSGFYQNDYPKEKGNDKSC